MTKRRLQRLAFVSDISWDLMKQNTKNPHSAPYRPAESKIALDDPIRHFKVWSAGEKPPADHNYIRLDESLRESVTDNFEEFEQNYFTHTFVTSSYSETAEGKAHLMYKYFSRDAKHQVQAGRTWC